MPTTASSLSSATVVLSKEAIAAVAATVDVVMVAVVAVAVAVLVAVVEVLALLARVVMSSTRSLVVTSLSRWSPAGVLNLAGLLPDPAGVLRLDPAGVLRLDPAGVLELNCVSFSF